MFYVSKFLNIESAEVGDRVMVLADYCNIPAGSKGTVTENYKSGIMIKWDDHKDLSDGFAIEELRFLAVESEVCPKEYLQ